MLELVKVFGGQLSQSLDGQQYVDR